MNVRSLTLLGLLAYSPAAASAQRNFGIVSSLQSRLRILLAQVPVDLEKRLQEVRGVGRGETRCVLQDRRHGPLEKRLCHLDPAAAEILREDLGVKRSRRAVAGFIAREDRERRIDILIEQEREERDFDRRIR